MQGGGHAAVADLGGSIITGIDGNPLAVLAAQVGPHDGHTVSTELPSLCSTSIIPSPGFQSPLPNVLQPLTLTSPHAAGACIATAHCPCLLRAERITLHCMSSQGIIKV